MNVNIDLGESLKGYVTYRGDKSKEYCFYHAVHRAFKGEKIETKLNFGDEPFYTYCEDCQEEEEKEYKIINNSKKKKEKTKEEKYGDKIHKYLLQDMVRVNITKLSEFTEDSNADYFHHYGIQELVGYVIDIYDSRGETFFKDDPKWVYTVRFNIRGELKTVDVPESQILGKAHD